ncbi:MAG TPA: PSD1 and planctomycete cytochrome C domain-containing protein [Pirellulales bacterium]|nr:PSD1 and planctomycete cytochrome C domain-containing protein [Pirellulales bacterium]
MTGSRPLRFLFLLASCCGLAGLIPSQARAAEGKALPPAAPHYDFQRDIRPILESSCVGCHNADRKKGEFRLDTRDNLLKGGENGVVVVPGKSGESDLIKAVARLDKGTAMPPDQEQALSAAQVGLLRAWIDDGARFPEGFVLRTLGVVRLDKQELAKLPPPAAKKIDFVKDVQPLFAAHCLACHGPDKHEALFRLDHKPTVFAGGELGPAVVPGKSAESLLIHLVSGVGLGPQMPNQGAPLSAEEIGVLRAWIDQGADFPDSASVVIKNARDHWAFKPPARPPLPQVAAELLGDATNPIDRFVAAKLAAAGLKFSPPAERATLLRRLHLDLTGLPPTVAELDAFMKDDAPDAYQKVVEQLLASPHYGERWGRHWLDAARYADSDGYEKDKPRFAHFYRDWVIGAFNRDLPYDQFIIEQIAGDRLPHPTPDQLVATGYLRNSMLNEEGGVDPEQFRMEAIIDRMDAIGKGILGLGLNCCQCHTHKYDPITQEEYYRLFAFLNNDHESQPRFYSPSELLIKADLHRQIAAIETKLQHDAPDWAERMAASEKAWRAEKRPEWIVVRPQIDKNSTEGQRFLPQPDGSIVAASYEPTKSTWTMTFANELANITGFRLELLRDPSLPGGGPGRSFLGTFALSEFKAEVKQEGKNQPIKIASATADLNAPAETAVHPNFNEKKPLHRVIGPIQYALDGNNDTGWSSDLGPGRRNLESVAVFAAEKPIPAGELTVRLVQNIGGYNSDDLQANQIGRFRLSITTAEQPHADPVPVLVRQALDVPSERRSPEQVATIFSYWRTTVVEWKDANEQIEKLWQRHPEGATQMTLTARDEPRATALLKRGDWLKPGKLVTTGVPEILNPLPPGATSDRLTLARWLVDRKSPTTARVFVNRMWQAYFGTGIVSTSEDFGTQSEPPSHPELLDWLAVEFMDHGWSVKHIQRLIVSSRTYQQASAISPELWQKDPYNRLLSRGPRFRVEGEIVRDIQLSVSGLLNPKMGGRSVMPPAPLFIFQPPASYAPFPWKEEQGEDRYRRAVYTWRRRTTPYPFLQTFDTPDGNVACIRRTRANTPLQALMGLNETVSLEAARAFAKRILSTSADDHERISYAFRAAVSRLPSERERATIDALLAKQRERIAAGQLNPWLVATGKADEQPDLLLNQATAADLASYTVAARVILNLDETITKE